MTTRPHKTRYSDSSLYDSVCEYCGDTDPTGECPRAPDPAPPSPAEPRKMRDVLAESKSYVRCLEYMWERSPVVGHGRDPSTGDLLHEQRLIEVTRIWQDGVLCDQFASPAEQPAGNCPDCDGTGGYTPGYVAGEIVGPDACGTCSGTGDVAEQPAGGERQVIADCGCVHCLKAKPVTDDYPVPHHRRRMVVCEYCGNKRCPHAEYHGYVCTWSNEPGQVGVIGTSAPPPAASPQGSELPDSWGHWLDKDSNHWWIFGRPGRFMAQCLDPETGIPDDETPATRLQAIDCRALAPWSRVPPEPAELAALRQRAERAEAAFAKLCQIYESECEMEGVSRPQWARDVLQQADANWSALRQQLAEARAERDAAEAALSASRERERVLLKLCLDHLIQPEYDCPGDTPEVCGYFCMECRGSWGLADEPEHKSDCPLAATPAGQGESATQPAAAGGGE